uniref:G-protein coupled receptors family 1 profile domain-containing protein n=1 Tax=Romanomermis culicivorax TaxID=13658 RepID=A0A915JD79_ROMCU
MKLGIDQNDNFTDLYQSGENIPVYILLYAIIFGISAVVGSIGNVLVEIDHACFRDKKLRKIKNGFIVSLAAADFWVSTVTMPASIAGVLIGRVWFDTHHLICAFTSIVCAPACIASVYSIAFVACHRYFYIGQYALSVKYFSIRGILIDVAFIWSLGFIIHIPNHAGWGTTRYSFMLRFCSLDTDLHSYGIFYAFMVVLALASTFVFYVKIYGVLRRSSLAKKIILAGTAKNGYRLSIRFQVEFDSANDSSESRHVVKVHNFLIIFREQVPQNLFNAEIHSWCRNGVRDELKNRTIVSNNPSHLKDWQLKEEVKIIKVSFRIFLVFFVTWLPLTLLILSHLGDKVPPWVYLLAGLLAHCNSTLNFIFYFLCDDMFKKGLKRLVIKAMPVWIFDVQVNNTNASVWQTRKSTHVGPAEDFKEHDK